MYNMSGAITLSLRLVTGWTYFSAFWRRLILADKLNPDSAGYIGEKFNHFLPNALFIKPGIEYLATHEDTLWWFMVIFTIIEAIVGLLFILGLFTRFMSIGVIGLALGILLGAGWLGTTCLDEWQIGVLGIAAGFTIFLSGGGYYSLDSYLIHKKERKTQSKLYRWLASGALNLNSSQLKNLALIGAISISAITLFTNQYFHGGLWGKLHNLSVKPKVEITDAEIKNDRLSLTVYRTEGADVYGSFLINVALYDSNDSLVAMYNADSLAAIPNSNIHNKYVTKVKPGKHSLIIPLGAKADLHFTNNLLRYIPLGTYKLVLTDISGITWTKEIKI